MFKFGIDVFQYEFKWLVNHDEYTNVIKKGSKLSSLKNHLPKEFNKFTIFTADVLQTHNSDRLSHF